MMFNKNFKDDWRVYNGQISVLTTKHLSIDVDKDYIGLGIEISHIYRLIYIKLLNLVFTVY